MPLEKKLPKPGDLLVHQFRRKGRADISAQVVSVDSEVGKVVVKVGDTTYKSLSAAAFAIAGCSVNGWIFWGLRKELPRPQGDDSANDSI